MKEKLLFLQRIQLDIERLRKHFEYISEYSFLKFYDSKYREDYFSKLDKKYLLYNTCKELYGEVSLELCYIENLVFRSFYAPSISCFCTIDHLQIMLNSISNIIRKESSNIIKTELINEIFEYKYKTAELCTISWLNQSFISGILDNANNLHLDYNADYKKDIKIISDKMIYGFLKSLRNKNIYKYKGKKVGIDLFYGQEQIGLEIIKGLHEMDINSYIRSYKNNNEYDDILYDHIHDEALFCSESYMKQILLIREKSINNLGNEIKKCIGIIEVSTFGSVLKEKSVYVERPLISKNELDNMLTIESKSTQLLGKVFPKKKYTFQRTSFPDNSIDESIKKEILALYAADDDAILKYQEKLIHMLDKFSVIHIKGCNGSLTNLFVNIEKKLDNHQTKFYNMGSERNLPAGEIYCTPNLNGTNGIIHLNKTFINNDVIVDLFLKIENGMIVEYNCKNFLTEEENIKFLDEKLFENKGRMPISEFAIGTNKKLYDLLKSYHLLDKVPVIILEKTAPHIAIGDTCYAREENQVYYNENGKEVVMKSNELTSSKSEDENTYFNNHIDIVIPFDTIGYIYGIRSNGDEEEIFINNEILL